VKQNLLSASVLLFVTLALILSSSACAKLTRRASATVQYDSASRSANGSAININTASSPELEKLRGVGKGIAERIIAHREHYGRFRRPEHLMIVRGISDRKFREIREMIVVD
jgi:competence ComEA-like helix-hairpin-helix protein